MPDTQQERGQLTRAQVDQLLQPIKPGRVFQAQGQSHVPAYDVVAHLTRMFGFAGWDKEIIRLELAHERSTPPQTDKDQGRWWVTYRCVMRLTVRDQSGRVVKIVEDAATGSAQNMPSPADAHDFAAKNAVSYAIKRCAKDLGDQFGLSLYNKGATGALIRKTLVMPDGSTVEAEDVQAGIPTPASMGNDERHSEDEPPVESAEIHPLTGELEFIPEYDADGVAAKTTPPAITDRQKKHISITKKECIEHGVFDEAVYRDRLRKDYDVESITKLTEAQAAELLTRLQQARSKAAVANAQAQAVAPRTEPEIQAAFDELDRFDDEFNPFGIPGDDGGGQV